MDKGLSGLFKYLPAIIGVGVAIYYGRKATKLERLRKTISWHDLQTYADSLALSLRQDGFIPELILAPGIRGGVIAELLLNRFGRNIPVLVGVSHRHFGQGRNLDIHDYHTFKISDDWDIFIPNAVFSFADQRVLIVDDFCLTGEFFETLRDFLVNGGFGQGRIRVYCCVITNVTKSAGRTPEHVSKIVDDDLVYFPWGKAHMG